MKTVRAFVLVVLCGLALAGCKKPERLEPMGLDYEAQLPPGELALRRITDYRQIPDFTPACTDLAGLKEAITNSLNYLSKPSSRKHFPYGTITREQAVASLKAMAALVDSRPTPQAMNAALRRDFDVYISVGCDTKGTVLFTGYYTPIFNGSPVRTEKFKYPLHKPPAGLVKNLDGTPSAPMPDRRTIETRNLYAGQELVWLADPFEVYVAHIQGSAKLRMPDGKLVTVGYTANNGHEYRSVRAELVKDGKIGKRDGLPAMIRYFRAHPEEVKSYTWRNPRFIFFAVVADGRPRGSINEPVTTRRTIATDKTIYPPACLAFVSTQMPKRLATGTVDDAPFGAFALDQDTGGAIRAAGRCDVYLGVGAEAGELAGRAQNEGRLYYLFLKPAPAGPTAP
ncbi:MAG: MltA domain-containing protein [Phycisphaerae bacterium]|nr:MltA domain-containing protein [Phycisphaerae bacterium]